MAAPIRIDAPDLVHHLVDQPRLLRRDDELLEERLHEPTRHAGRVAGAQRVVLDALLDALELLEETTLVLGRELRRRKRAFGLVRVPEERARFPRPNAGPVWDPLPGKRLAASGLLLQVLIKIPGRAVLDAEVDHALLLGRGLHDAARGLRDGKRGASGCGGRACQGGRDPCLQIEALPSMTPPLRSDRGPRTAPRIITQRARAEGFGGQRRAAAGFRRSAFDAISCRSARSISASTATSSRGRRTVIPTLAEIDRGPSRVAIGARTSVSRIRWIAASVVARSPSAISTRNSSPPRRQTTSSARTLATSRSPTRRRT